jgi:low affinity Fe/Cu permease
MGQLGHEYCVHNGFNRSHAGKYVYSLATFISWILIYFLLKFLGGLSPYWNVIISSAITALLFLTFYFLFDKWIWCQRHFKIDPFYLKNGEVKLTPLISY